MKKILILTLLLILSQSNLFSAEDNCTLGGNCDTQVHSTISIQLNNSYNGSIDRGDTNFTSGGLLWTNDTIHPIVISTSDTAQYTSSGDIAMITGVLTTTFTTGYQDIITITLSPNNGPKQFNFNFLKEQEPYQSNILEIMLDNTAPTFAVPVNLIDGVLYTGESIQLQRDQSYDVGVGLSHYIVAISLDPYFTNPIYIATTGTYLTIPTNTIAAGTIYRTITSVDFLGNKSTTSRQYFHYLEASKPKATIGGLLNPPLSNNQAIGNHSIPNVKQENIINNSILILSNNQILVLDSTISEIQKQQISQNLIDQFHKSPATNSWMLPGFLPKTGSWSNNIPHTCYYETCLELNMLRQILYILLIVLFLFALRRTTREN